MGVIAALIFALQMINFTISVGNLGHLLGGAVVAILLGSFAVVIVISVVLIIQTFILIDGGVAALDANIFNMAIIGVFSAYLIYWLIGRIYKSKIFFYTSVSIAS